MTHPSADHQRIIEQIRQLRALAESTSINEAAAAAHAAQRLIEKHRISQGVLDKARDLAESPDTGVDDDPVIQGFLPADWWGFFLLAVVAESHGLVSVYETELRTTPAGPKKPLVRHFVIGVREDREIVKTLFTEVFFRLRALLKAEMHGRPRSHAWQQDWGLGAGCAIQKQLRAAKRETAREANGSRRGRPGRARSPLALALKARDDRNKEMLALVEKNTMNIDPGEGVIIAKNRRAYDSGYAKGKGVSVAGKSGSCRLLE